jgi:soluble lytic murein transglycosylase-like protein
MVRKVQQSAAASHQAHATKKSPEKTADFRETLEKNRRTPGRSRTRARGGPQARGPHMAKLSVKHAKRLAQFAPLIARNAAKYGVPVDLICGLMVQESGANPKARSHVGATGLMQLMPATARRMGVTNIHDPAQNIEGGVKYLRYLMDLFPGDVNKVLAGYNAGEGAVKKYGGIPPYRETQNYVPRVKAYARTVGHVLRGGKTGGMQMGAVVRNTMPRHAAANFMPGMEQSKPPAPERAASVARRMARM